MAIAAAPIKAMPAAYFKYFELDWTAIRTLALASGSICSIRSCN